VGSACHFCAALRRSAHMRQSQEQGGHNRGPLATKRVRDGRGIVIIVAKTSRRCLS
jgi:hypothetical protein